MGDAVRPRMSAAFRGLGYLCGLIDAAAFGLAATAKFRDPAGTARGLRDLGIGRPWLFARLLPPCEALLAVGLIVVGAPVAVVAVGVLAAFAVFLGGRLRAGVTAPCACFGAWQHHPLTTADVVRTVLLAVAAMVAAAGSGPVVPGVGAVAATVAMAGLGGVIVTALRRRSR